MDVDNTPTTREAFAPAAAPTKKPEEPSFVHALPARAFAGSVLVALFAAAAASSGAVELVLPNIWCMLEAGLFVALGALVAPLPFFALLWCSHGGNVSSRATPLLDVVTVAYGTCTLCLPFFLSAPNSGGLAHMGMALLTWIAYWKMLDVVGGTHPPAVLASPRNLFVHLVVLVEYRISGYVPPTPSATPQPPARRAIGSAASAPPAAAPPSPAPPAPAPQRTSALWAYWELVANDGRHGVETAHAGECVSQLVTFVLAGGKMALLGSLRLLPPPAWLSSPVYEALLA
jgi:hypothetical protein